MGFAGARVIRQTIGEDLPPGFQRAEFVLEKGFIDRIVHRKQMREEVGAPARVLLALDARLRARRASPRRTPTPRDVPATDAGTRRPDAVNAVSLDSPAPRSRRLYGLERRQDKLGLEGTARCSARSATRSARFRSVHVAGTNGKGSVCALIERVLREAGVRTGLFTSPHLVDFRERIRVNGRWADEARLDAAPRRIAGAARGPRTARSSRSRPRSAFDYFARAAAWSGRWSRWDSAGGSTAPTCSTPEVCVDHLDRARSHRDPGRHARADRGREGRHRQAGRAGGASAAAGLDRGARSSVVARVRELARRRCAVHSPLAVDGRRSDRALRRADAPAPRTLAPRSRVLAVLRDARRSRSRPRRAARGLARARWPGRLERVPDRAAAVVGRRPQRRRRDRAADRAWRETLSARRPAAIVLALSRDKDAAAMLARAARRLAPARDCVVTRSAQRARARRPSELARRAARPASRPSARRDVRGRDPRGARRGRARAACCSPARCSRSARRWRRFGGAPGEMAVSRLARPRSRAGAGRWRRRGARASPAPRCRRPSPPSRRSTSRPTT